MMMLDEGYRIVGTIPTRRRQALNQVDVFAGKWGSSTQIVVETTDGGDRISQYDHVRALDDSRVYNRVGGKELRLHVFANRDP